MTTTMTAAAGITNKKDPLFISRCRIEIDENNAMSSFRPAERVCTRLNGSMWLLISPLKWGYAFVRVFVYVMVVISSPKHFVIWQCPLFYLYLSRFLTVFHFSANKQNHVIGPRKFVWLKNSYICILSMILWARSIGKCNINVVLFWTHQSNNKNDIFVRKNGSSVCNALYFLFENTLHHLCGEWALSPSLLSIFLFSEWERTRATKFI